MPAIIQDSQIAYIWRGIYYCRCHELRLFIKNIQDKNMSTCGTMTCTPVFSKQFATVNLTFYTLMESNSSGLQSSIVPITLSLLG
jgi:hypothetical protein